MEGGITEAAIKHWVQNELTGISDGVKQYTGKDEYAFGDISVATVKKLKKRQRKMSPFESGLCLCFEASGQ